jgi:integral membrane protein
MFNTALGRFRIIAFLEGCSFLLIGLTMILKYKYEMPGPNYVVGMAHGLLFILYVGLLLYVAYLYKWPFWKVALSFLASLIPFGTFYADKKLFRGE